jgi:hypothetical protein
VSNNDPLSLQIMDIGNGSDRANRLALPEVERDVPYCAGKAAFKKRLLQEARLRKVYVANTSTPRRCLNLKIRRGKKKILGRDSHALGN